MRTPHITRIPAIFAKMETQLAERCLRQISSVLYVACDELIPARGNALSGFDEFSAALDHAGVPVVWLSNRTRLQLDEARRKLSHTHPFIAEGGAGVYLPEDYFHLRPERVRDSGSPREATVRLGRFTCLPVAQQQPAAADALESLASDSGVAIVRLSSLSPRELAQNSGLPPREAELARHRDFDEPFFFVGASPAEIEHFKNMALEKKCQVRARGSLWSLAIRASVPLCIRELSKLYDRALHSHARSVALAVQHHHEELAMACDRTIVLALAADPQIKTLEQSRRRVIAVPMRPADRWEQILAAVLERH